jgi:hypothetical protein
MDLAELRTELLRTNVGAKREREVRDDDIEIGDRTVLFQDPVTLERITHPGRFEGCVHLQCFDLTTLIECQINENLTGFNCAVCYVKMEASELRVDTSFLRLLEKYDGENGCVVSADGRDRGISKAAVVGDDVIVVRTLLLMM